MREWSNKPWARHGSAHSQWKGGRSKDAKGYRKLNINLIEPEYHDMCDRNGWILEHRYLMAKHLGRPLNSQELVHHKDDDKENNHIDNLLLTTRGDHMREHRSWERMSESSFKNKRKIFCKELDKVFLGINDAAKALNISRDSIFRSLRDGRAHANFTFFYCEGQ